MKRIIDSNCLCGASDCESCGTAQGFASEQREREIEQAAAAILDTYLADPYWIGEAASALTDDEYAAIDDAHAARDAMALFRVRDAAVTRVLKQWATGRSLESLRPQGLPPGRIYVQELAPLEFEVGD